MIHAAKILGLFAYIYSAVVDIKTLYGFILVGVITLV